jgi:integral membrane protein
VKGALSFYKVIATVVGVLLIVLVLVGLPMDLLASEGSSAKDAGRWISQNVGVAHGWLYMVYLVTTFILSRKAGWDLPFTLVTLICGTIPIASFWAELRAIHRVQAEHPELESARA